MRSPLLIFFFLFVLLRANAQQPFLHGYTVSDGLPSNEVYDVFQDSRGFLWFATDAGASCYDGYQFVNYTSRDGLPDNVVFGFFEDHCGRIWFRTYNGLLSYYNGSGIVAPEVNAELRGLIGGNMLNSIYVDEKDTVWLGLTGGASLIRILPDFRTIEKRKPETYDNEVVREMERGKYLIIGRSDIRTGVVDVLFFPFKSSEPVVLRGTGRNASGIYCMAIPGGGTLMNIDQEYYEIADGKIIYSADSMPAIRFAGVQKNSYWACMSEQRGARQIGFNSKQRNVLRSLLEGLSVTDCQVDHEGGLWFTTLEKGIFYMPYPEVEEFGNFSFPPGEKFTSLSLFSEKHLAVLTTKGNIFCPGCDQLQPEPTGNAGGYFTSMLRWQGKLAVGANTGSFFIDPVTDKKTMFLDSAGNTVVVGSLAGLDENNICGVNVRSALSININSGKTDVLCEILPERMRCICRGKNDTLWMGGLTGLWAMVKGQSPVSIGLENPALAERIDFMYYDSTRDRLWMSTKGSGLLLREKGQFIDLKYLDPAIPPNCRAIYADEENNVWVATNAGAFCVTETNDGQFESREFSVRNGLSSNDIVGVNRLNDTMWFIAPDRIIRFRLDDYPENTSPPPMKVKKIMADGNEIRPWSKDTVREFNSAVSAISFQYAALSFKSFGHVNYLFRLIGADTNWKSTQSTEAVFYSLPPGDYCFQLMAGNNDGIRSASPLEFRFVILPPVWQRWWFLGTTGLIVLGASLTLIRNRFQRLRRAQLFNQRLVEMEMTALRAQMSPHFIFNAINSIHNFVLTGDRNLSATYLSKFAKLIRNVLENSSQKQIPLAKEIETLQLYLEIERMRFSDDFSFRIETDEKLDPANILIIPLLLQPYVENAIWHGLLHKKGNGTLTVSISDVGEMLSCVIDDDGVGREAAAQNKRERGNTGSSLGGEISQRRLNLLNDLYGTKYSVTYTDKKNGDGTAAGTRVELLIPKFNKT